MTLIDEILAKSYPKLTEREKRHLYELRMYRICPERFGRRVEPLVARLTFTTSGPALVADETVEGPTLRQLGRGESFG